MRCTPSAPSARPQSSYTATERGAPLLSIHDPNEFFGSAVMPRYATATLQLSPRPRRCSLRVLRASLFQATAMTAQQIPRGGRGDGRGARRTALGSRAGRGCNAPPHPRPQEEEPGGRHSAGRRAAALRGPQRLGRPQWRVNRLGAPLRPRRSIRVLRVDLLLWVRIPQRGVEGSALAPAHPNSSAENAISPTQISRNHANHPAIGCV